MKVEDQTLHRKRVFYEDYADGTFKFGSGKELKVCRAFLAVESLVLDQLFRDSSPENIVEIPDYDFDTFKLFLDCLMGFETHSVPETLLIFPIAWNFRTLKFVKKCLHILKPVRMNEDVCSALNLASLCECKELKKLILQFFQSKWWNVNILFHEEKYYLLLEPESVAELLKNKLINLDSYNLINILKWGKHYITEHSSSTDLKTLFVKYGIDKFLSADCFETKGSFYEFYKTELGKSYFTFKEYEYVAENSKFRDSNSYWQNVRAGDVLIEKIRIKNVSFFEDYVTYVSVLRHHVKLYNSSQRDIKVFMTEDYDLKIIHLNNKMISAHAERAYGIYPSFLKIDLKTNIVSDLEIEVRRTCYANGRILKQTPLNFEVIEPNAENTSLTYSVTFDHEKK